MGIKTQKVLRLISKIILILVGVGLVGIAGYYVYKSITFKPQNVVVTNITDGSATVTWTTSSPMKGIVYVKKDKGLLPGPLGIIGSAMTYDDRDVSDAQKDCVDAFNKKASETKDSTFGVSGSNFDCENVKVTKMGSYYTHSVTMTNLDENSTYNFVVGDGIWSFKENISMAKTFAVLETVGEPKPIFGKIIGDDGLVSKDGLAYITFNDGSESKDSIVYSSTTNDNGGWYLDASSVRDAQGNVIDLELTDDTFKLKGIYSNYGVSGEEKYILGYFNGAYPDVVVKKTEQKSLSIMKMLAKGIYARDLPSDKEETTKTVTPVVPKTPTPAPAAVKTPAETKAAVEAVCTKCIAYVSPADLNKIAAEKAEGGTSATLQSLATSIGAGNAAKISAALSPDGNVNFTDINLTKNAGNINALLGTQTPYVKPGEEANSNVNYNGVSSGGGYGNLSVSGYCGDKKCNNGETQGSCFTDCQASTQAPNNTGGTGGATANSCTTDPDSDNCSIYCDKHPNTTTCKVVFDPNYCTSSACQNLTTTTYQTCIDHVKAQHPGQCEASPKCLDSKNHNIGEECDNGLLCTDTGCNRVNNVNKEKCSVTAKYNNRGDLSSCTMSCNEGEINIGSNKCLSILPPDNKDITQSSGADYSTELTTEVLVNEISLKNLAKIPVRLEELVNASPKIKENVQNGLKVLADAHNNDFTTWTYPDRDIYYGYCKSLGGNPDSVDESPFNANVKLTCDDIPGASNIKGVFDIAKAYAAETTNGANSYTLYMPEYGTYSFELGDYTVTTQVSDGKTMYLFYVESNGTAGFQMPADPDKPTATEDIVLSSNASQITYKKESTAQQYAIKKGINIISFNFVPVSTSSGAYTAKDVISQASTNGVEVQYISTFEGGRWNSGYSCSRGTCTGSNFAIVPGKGYLVYATQDGTVTIPGYNLTSSVPVAFSAGWNLVGVHGYTTAYTARSFIDSINKIEGLTANNVSWWPTSKSKYEGLQVDGATEYGLDFSMSPNNGYFVRISKFAPTDTKCKSLIWNAGGSLNGTCGNTK